MKEQSVLRAACNRDVEDVSLEPDCVEVDDESGSELVVESGQNGLDSNVSTQASDQAVLLDDSDEDDCFVCKDGGHLMLCDFQQKPPLFGGPSTPLRCHKAYHDECLAQEAKLFNETVANIFSQRSAEVVTKDTWCCPRHLCTRCTIRPSDVFCLMCPFAMCKTCAKDGPQFIKGCDLICEDCLPHTVEIELNATKTDAELDATVFETTSGDRYVFNETGGIKWKHAYTPSLFRKYWTSVKQHSKNAKLWGQKMKTVFDTNPTQKKPKTGKTGSSVSTTVSATTASSTSTSNAIGHETATKRSLDTDEDVRLSDRKRRKVRDVEVDSPDVSPVRNGRGDKEKEEKSEVKKKRRRKESDSESDSTHFRSTSDRNKVRSSNEAMYHVSDDLSVLIGNLKLTTRKTAILRLNRFIKDHGLEQGDIIDASKHPLLRHLFNADTIHRNQVSRFLAIHLTRPKKTVTGAGVGKRPVKRKAGKAVSSKEKTVASEDDGKGVGVTDWATGTQRSSHHATSERAVRSNLLNSSSTSSHINSKAGSSIGSSSRRVFTYDEDGGSGYESDEAKLNRLRQRTDLHIKSPKSPKPVKPLLQKKQSLSEIDEEKTPTNRKAGGASAVKPTVSANALAGFKIAKKATNQEEDAWGTTLGSTSDPTFDSTTADNHDHNHHDSDGMGAESPPESPSSSAHRINQEREREQQLQQQLQQLQQLQPLHQSGIASSSSPPAKGKRVKFTADDSMLSGSTSSADGKGRVTARSSMASDDGWGGFAGTTNGTSTPPWEDSSVIKNEYIRDILLSRSVLDSLVDSPIFKNLVTNCFVRCSSTINGRVSTHLARIQDVVDCEPYLIEPANPGRLVRKRLVIQYQGHTSTLALSNASNKDAMTHEYETAKHRMSTGDIAAMTPEDMMRKARQVQAAKQHAELRSKLVAKIALRDLYNEEGKKRLYRDVLIEIQDLKVKLEALRGPLQDVMPEEDTTMPLGRNPPVALKRRPQE
eukprot:GILK01007900.1.p1 GENE.GILK01007900.1~~GILK01007900.1.p1  ORF type:complete len:998 (+),score=250.31 GILK01007900.1:31-2994(+)